GYARHALEEAFSCYLPPLQCDDVTETLQPHAQVTAFNVAAPPLAATLQNRRKPLGQWHNRRIVTLKSPGRPKKENRVRNDPIVRRAAAYAIQTISEAVRRIPDAWLADFPSEPWGQIKGIGSRIRHE